MNQLDMKGRIAVITGGAQGLGYAVAERMLKSGAAVALWDMNEEQLAKAMQHLAALGAVSTAVVNVFGAPPIDGLGATGGMKLMVEHRGDHEADQGEACGGDVRTGGADAVDESHRPRAARALCRRR